MAEQAGETNIIPFIRNLEKKILEILFAKFWKK
jgi:hypothetical protein